MSLANYNDSPMTDMPDADYDIVCAALCDHLATLLRGAPHYDANSAASWALAITWQSRSTAREWLVAAGANLGVDTSGWLGVWRMATPEAQS